jgi:DUF4097 and DUF4098 domain-containing protein YvlB
MPAGTVQVVAGATEEVVVRLSGSERDLESFVVEQRGDTVVVEPGLDARRSWSSLGVVVEAPRPPEVRARLGSGDLSAVVNLAALAVASAAGRVDVGDVAGDASFSSASGGVVMGRVGGKLDAALASGGLRVGAVAGAVAVRSAAGDVSLGEAGAAVMVRTASGDVAVPVFRGDDLDVKTLSGDVTVGVPAGRRLALELQTYSGDVKVGFPVGEDAPESAAGRLAVRSMSGDIAVVAAVS